MRTPIHAAVLFMMTLAVSLIPIAAVQALELAPNAPETYVVRKGDTLWEISGRFLRDPWRWHELWKANSGISNPDLIYPGDVLRLRMVNGQPRLELSRGGEAPMGYQGDMRVVKLTPKVRVTSLQKAVPVIPIGAISPFLSRPFITDSDQLEHASYVVGFPKEHIMVGIGDSLYVRSIDSYAHKTFQILRPGKPLHDPDTNELLGYQADYIATATLERTGDPAKLTITDSGREAAIGDRVIPASDEKPLTNFYPRPAPAGTRAQILSVLGGVSQIGQFNIVTINCGAHDGIKTGHVFEIFVGGEKERDQVRSGTAKHYWDWRQEKPTDSEFWYGDYSVKGWRQDSPYEDSPIPEHVDVRKGRSTYIRPYERAGVLMVFRVFDRVSFGIILDATQAVVVGDQVSAPTPSS